MATLIAYCGLACDECKAFLATMAADQAQKQCLAEQWSTATLPLRADDVTCEGCASRLISTMCRHCDIRTCAVEHQVDNCAYCRDYPCPKLEHADPKAKSRLLAIRKALNT